MSELDEFPESETIYGARRLLLAGYVRDVADRIGLKDWRFTFRDDPPIEIDHEAASAAISPVSGRKWACLWVPASWWDDAPGDRRQTIAHELIHLHMTQAERIVETVQTNLGDAAWGVLRSAHTDAIEHGVDAVADVVAAHLPMPPPPPKPQQATRRARPVGESKG